MNGYIALHRKLFDNPTACKDSDHLAVWIYLLCHAVWTPTDVIFGGERITLREGQFTTGRRIIAEALKVSESKVQRILKRFEEEGMIEQRTDRQSRLITIVSWNEYQESEQRVNNGSDTFSELDEPNNAKIEQRVNNATSDTTTVTDPSCFETEQRVNNDRTTSEQRVNTKEEYKNNKNSNKGNSKRKNFKPPTIEDIAKYINEQHFHVNAEYFYDYYESNGWLVGKNKMKDWKATVRNWERRERKSNKVDSEDFETMLDRL